MQLLRAIMRFIGRQDYIRQGLRDRILRLYHNPDKSKSEPFEIPFFRYRFSGNLSSFIDWTIYYYGAYAGRELQLIGDVLSKMNDSTVLDVGANVGNHSLFASMFAKKVIAFEPVKNLSNQLQTNVQLNNISNINIITTALGAEETVGKFMLSLTANQGTGGIVSDNWHGETTTVKVVRGDDIIKELEIKRVDFIKVDVEGYEPFVLKGLEKTITDYRPFIFFEYSSRTLENLAEIDLSVLLPKDYIFFKFKEFEPKFFFFQSNRYRLQRARILKYEGNYLAVPEVKKHIIDQLLILESEIV